MKVALIIDVPDDFIEGRAAELSAELGETVTGREHLMARLSDIADDELPIALWGWPVTVTVEEHDG